jgi:hypothetical protein
MIEAKCDPETEKASRATSQSSPSAFDDLLNELDELLELLANKAMVYSESLDDPMDPRVVMLAARRIMDYWCQARADSTPGAKVVRIENAWRCALIEAQERAHRVLPTPGEEDRSPQDALAALAEEIATYCNSLPTLLREQPGQFVLIKGTEIVGTFPDRSAALRAGYRRFGIVPFLVRQIAEPEPVVYLPNVVP